VAITRAGQIPRVARVFDALESATLLAHGFMINRWPQREGGAHSTLRAAVCHPR
jgi:hypothetical protein